MNVRLFCQDITAHLSSPWPPSQRTKAVGLLLIHCWNRYISCAVWNQVLHLTIRYRQRLLNLAMRMETDDFFAFQEIFVYHYYDHPLGEPATILDLGANCGYATLLFAARFPGATIAAVEPHPANLAALDSNLRLNGVSATVIAGAAVRNDGPVTLFARESLSHGLLRGHAAAGEYAITVAGLSVPTLMSQLGWDRIDLLKIDIEGYERMLFADSPAWLGRVTRIIGEYHGSYGLEAVRSDLGSLGFTVSPLPHRQMFLADRGDMPEKSQDT